MDKIQGNNPEEKQTTISKNYLSWKVLFLLFIITKVLVYAFPVRSLLSDILSFLSAILLVLGIVALLRQLLGKKEQKLL